MIVEGIVTFLRDLQCSKKQLLIVVTDSSNTTSSMISLFEKLPDSFLELMNIITLIL